MKENLFLISFVYLFIYFRTLIYEPMQNVKHRRENRLREKQIRKYFFKLIFVFLETNCGIRKKNERTYGLVFYFFSYFEQKRKS